MAHEQTGAPGRLRTGVAWLLVIGWLAFAFLALLLTLALALADPYGGLATGGFFPENLVAPLRTYLLRNALLNTLWLILAAGSAALLLAWLLTRRLAWRSLPGPTTLLLMAWLLPVPLAGLLWLPLLDRAIWLVAADTARVAIGWVLLWRLLPLAVLVLAHAPGRRGLTLTAAALAYSALVDSGTALLLTGGAPFNASHTWASWLLLQLWVSRAWSYAAVTAGGLALIAGLVAAAALWPVAGPTRGAESPAPGGSAARAAAWSIAALWCLPPWLAWIADAGAGWGDALRAFGATGGWVWVRNWMLAVVLSGAAALALAWAMRQTLRGPRRGARRAALVLAAALLPLLPVPIAYLRWTQAGAIGWWAAALIVGLLAAAPLALLPGDGTRRTRALAAVAWSVVLLGHSFPLELVLASARTDQLPGTGIAAFMGGLTAWPGPLAVGLWVGGALALVAAAVVVAALAQRPADPYAAGPEPKRAGVEVDAGPSVHAG